MKKVFPLVFLLFCTLYITAQEPQSINPITKELQYEMQQAAENDLFRINIRMKDQYDVESLLNLRHSLKPNELREYVVNELQSFTAQSQQGILAELNYYSRSGEVNEIRSLWIVNVINCYATSEVIEQLATRPDVVRIDLDEERVLINPEYGITQDGSDGSKEITYNVLKVNAPAVWDLGFTGQDIVVGVLDTGVRYTHNDLNGNMWTHPDYPYHGWNFINNTNNPNDDHGHGTHCAGTIAGNGASGSQTGIAPNAKIMALKILNNSGSGTESGVWAGIQFAVEHGANVLSMSIGWLHAWGPDRQAWRTTMSNTLAAGVIASVAAGNEGDEQSSYPIPDNIRTPGDCPPPWLHPDQTLEGGISAVVSVGATNSSDAIASFSGRGPVTWQSIAPFNDYPYNPGIGLIRPDIVAPGVDVKSLSYSSNTGYTTMSGTSMATPCVAGIMALMISKNDNLTPDVISQILEETALKLSPIKNNTTGSGRVNALAAIQATSFPGPVYASHSLNDIAGNNNGLINPSEFIEANIALQNNTENVYNNVSAIFTTDSPYITMVDGQQYYGTFNPGDTIEIAGAFSFQVANDIPGGHDIRFYVETTDGDESWQSYFNVSAHAPNLTSGNMTVYDPQGNSNGNLDPGESATLKIPTLNVGQIDSDPVNVTLSTESEYVTILNGSASLGVIPTGGSAIAEFDVIVTEDAPIGHSAAFIYTITGGAYTIVKIYYQKIGIIFEDFETGDFTAFPWSFGGNQPWTISNDSPYEGTFSARSGAISNSQSSELILEYDVGVNDSISFYYKVSSEANYDFLKFYINNQVVGQWAGNVPWTRAVFPVTGGLKIFKWQYVKDVSVAGGEDRAWIDYVVFPALASCPSPKNIHATSITASSAMLNWVPGGTESTWDIIWGPTGFNPENAGTLITDLTSSPYALTGLTPVTVYDFYVRAHCSGSEISAWNGPSSFTTLCDIFSIPYLEPFGTPSVTCWSFPEGQGNWDFGSSYTPPSGTAPNAYFGWSPSITNYSHSFTSPLFNGVGFSEIKLDFKLYINNYSTSTLEQMAVEYKTIGSNEWILLENFTNSGGTVQFVRTNQLLNGMAGQEFQVRFRAYGANSYNINGWGLDDIHVHGEELPSVLPGDANCDGVVNMLDGITIVNFVTGEDPQPFCFDNADVNEDGVVNLLDFIATVNIIMNGKKTSGLEINSSAANLYLNRYGIELESDGTLAGIQIELEGANINDLDFLLSGFEFASNVVNNKLIGVIFSFDNTPIPAGKINLFRFSNENNKYAFAEVVAGNLNAEEVKVIKHQYGSLQVNDTDFSLSAFPNPSKGQMTVEVSLAFTSETQVTVLDITGREVSQLHEGLLEQGLHRFDLTTDKKLSSGIYFLQMNVIPDNSTEGLFTKRIKLIVTE